MRIGFVGAGRVGKALGLFFTRRGLTLSGYCSRTPTSAAEAAGLTGSRTYETPEALAEDSNVVFLTVPDGALEALDARLARFRREKAFPEAFCVLHTSGALPSGCLAQLADAGCPVGSLHPLQSFGDPEESGARFSRTLITLEGTDRAVAIMEELLCQAELPLARTIPAACKPLYHAGACIASNYPVTLLESALKCFEAAGIGRTQAMPALLSLLESTVENLRTRNPAEALTGPVARGDADTVALHLAALARALPAELELYRVMGEKTAELTAEKSFAESRREKLLAVLKKGGA